MNLELEAMALAIPDVAGHPNRLAFRGVLTLVGVASPRAPRGAQGHRVMLTRAATDAALPSLLGMALDYAPSLGSHDVRRKIGIITEAEIVPLHVSHPSNTGLGGAPVSDPRGTGLEPALRLSKGGAHALGAWCASGRAVGRLAVSGYLFAHDFPDVVDDIRAQEAATGAKLGMSYELTKVEVPNRSASIWTATAFTFTGAAVLRRESAAYPQTWIEISS